MALDLIRDPGIWDYPDFDWFGIQQIVCSRETVDIYNPKVVQATMDSISRVNVAYLDLK
jgi:TrmH family RNA methyltransferase